MLTWLVASSTAPRANPQVSGGTLAPSGFKKAKDTEGLCFLRCCFRVSLMFWLTRRGTHDEQAFRIRFQVGAAGWGEWDLWNRAESMVQQQHLTF